MLTEAEQPGANWTKKLVERYGDRLIRVRDRYDPEQRRRLKTVELNEEQSAWTPSAAIYLVQIGYGETALGEKAKGAGARWNHERKLWILSGEAVRRPGPEERVVDWLEPGA